MQINAGCSGAGMRTTKSSSMINYNIYETHKSGAFF